MGANPFKNTTAVIAHFYLLVTTNIHGIKKKKCISDLNFFHLNRLDQVIGRNADQTCNVNAL